jgi:hypothetical protein
MSRWGVAWLARAPIRVRLTAWYLALLGLTLVALGGFLLLRLHADLVAGGSGLGLAICKELVQAHNGHIQADSQPGIGTTFTMLLPLHPPPR